MMTVYRFMSSFSAVVTSSFLMMIICILVPFVRFAFIMSISTDISHTADPANRAEVFCIIILSCVLLTSFVPGNHFNSI